MLLHYLVYKTRTVDERWVEDRTENLVAGGQARQEDLHVKAAVGADAVVLGLDVHMVLDQGSYPMCGFASVGYLSRFDW